MNEKLQASPKAPQALENLQEWFASLITRPLLKNDHINPIAPSGLVITKEAAQYITPSPTLRPHQRLQIYNQQYWWRLLNVLQTNFPLLVRLFGIQSFNDTIAVPFLSKYIPDHWSLNNLGARLPQWIQEDYQGKDKQLVYDAAYLDWIFAVSFLTTQYPPLDLNLLSQQDPDTLLTVPFCLQPHLFLLKWDYDLLTFRDLVINEGEDHWIDHDFPALNKEKTYYFAIFRNVKTNLAWKDLKQNEYLLLQQFGKGISIEEACDWISELEPEKQQEMTSHLQQWMQEWTRLGWLTVKPNIAAP